MKITAIETINLSKGITVHSGPIQWLWVRIHTDDGLTGLGETYYLPRAVSAIIHDTLAPLLIGRNPLDIENSMRQADAHLYSQKRLVTSMLRSTS